MKAVTKQEMINLISENAGQINVSKGENHIFNDGTVYPPAAVKPTVVSINADKIRDKLGPYLVGEIEIYSNYRSEISGTYYVPEA